MQHRFGEERRIDSSSRTGLMTQSVEIADGLDYVEVKAGDTIINAGDDREFFYFVEKGCVEEHMDGNLRFTHGAGDYFGEEAFLNQT